MYMKLSLERCPDKDTELAALSSCLLDVDRKTRHRIVSWRSDRDTATDRQHKNASRCGAREEKFYCAGNGYKAEEKNNKLTVLSSCIARWRCSAWLSPQQAHAYATLLSSMHLNFPATFSFILRHAFTTTDHSVSFSFQVSSWCHFPPANLPRA